MSHAYSRPDELLSDLGLDPSCYPIAYPNRFPLRVPRGYAARMRYGDPNDPLLRQVLPLISESESVPGYSADPVGDLASQSGNGLLQKYRGRALVVTTGACAVHCRYCFRRDFPYADNTATRSGILSVMRTLGADAELSEVILSGGDPLSLSDQRLADWLNALGGLSQLRQIRLHTRTAVVLPERITPALLQLLSNSPVPIVVVVHANHAQEIDTQVGDRLKQLREHCQFVLNQSVLLRGINNSVSALAALSERLFACGTLPYYLHQLDRAAGVAHFEVADDEATRLIDQLAARLPGYLVPRLVREVAGAPAKQSIAPGQHNAGTESSLGFN